MLLRRQGIVLGQHQQHTHQPRRYGYSLRRSNIQRNASVLQPPSQPKLVYTVPLLNRWGKRAQSCMCRAAAAGHVGMQGSTQAGCRGAVQVRCAARSAKQAILPAHHQLLLRQVVQRVIGVVCCACVNQDAALHGCHCGMRLRGIAGVPPG